MYFSWEKERFQSSISHYFFLIKIFLYSIVLYYIILDECTNKKVISYSTKFMLYNSENPIVTILTIFIIIKL